MNSAAINKRIRKQAKKKAIKEPMQVFCRVRPLSNESDPICLQIIPPCHVQMSPPTIAYALRNGPVRDVRFTFKQVFDECANQKTVFDNVALLSVENVLCGKNALIFTYGVTGTGKTYTMTGSPQDGGIMPRCLDVIFNSISKWKANKYIFKPDKLNGYEIQSKADAKADYDQDLILKIHNKNKAKIEKKESEFDCTERIPDEDQISTLDEDNCYAVFVTYVEIYNNTVYDLLEDMHDEGTRPKPLQPKIVREDSNHNMFVHGVNEVEVSSTEEAFEVYYRGQKRKRMAHTTLNSESSRSHSIFTIRIVQVPTDDLGDKGTTDKTTMTISQLSLVDLAGSERTSRTKNTGQRLREAGNINNSLMTLRTCLELLRENQNGGNKIIPYRDSRLTHLFKNFFDGEGQVTMVICVSPHVDDYEEIMHVMKFAEMSQDVQIPVSTPIKTVCFTPRRKAYQANRPAINDYAAPEREVVPATAAAGDFKEKQERFDSPGVSQWYIDIPDSRFIDCNDETTLPKLITHLEEGSNLFGNITRPIRNNAIEFKKKLVNSGREKNANIEELNTLKNSYASEKEKVTNLENQIMISDSELIKMKRKHEDLEMNIKRLKRELSQKELLISKNELEKQKVEDDFNQKMVQAQEKLNREMERKLRSQKSALQYEMRTKENKLKAMKRLLGSDESLDRYNLETRLKNGAESKDSRSAESLATLVPEQIWTQPGTSGAGSTNPSAPQTPSHLRPTTRKMGVAVANRRHRRSRSAGNDVWLDHRPQAHVPYEGTLMQPTMPKRKSITKLTAARDVTGVASKYCLLTQGQDSDGDMETRLYKGDVIPTAGGGAQVMFNDVEVVRQYSPTQTSDFKCGEKRQKIEDASGISPSDNFKKPRL